MPGDRPPHVDPVWTPRLHLRTVLAAAVLGVKSFSAMRVARLPVPRVLSGCAVLDVRAAAVSPATAST